MIDEKSFVPKLERHGSKINKGETNLNNVLMFTLSGSILLVRMRAIN
jgi:hypothetical protein